MYEFEDFPGRPEHPDFWRLSEIILQMDVTLGEKQERVHTRDEAADAYEQYVADVVDPRSIVYMAYQRALRLLRVQTYGELTKFLLDPNRSETINKLMAAYVEAFCVGYRFCERGGKQPIGSNELTQEKTAPARASNWIRILDWFPLGEH